MRLIEMKCKKCGADLEIDLDKFQAYCPYCGTKLHIDMKNIDKVMGAKEKTKRAKIFAERDKQRNYYEYKINEKKEKRKDETFDFIKMIFACILFFVIAVFLLKFKF